MGYIIGLALLLLSALLLLKPKIIRWACDHTTIAAMGGWDALGDRKGRYERAIALLQWTIPVFVALTGVAWIAWELSIQ